MVYGIILIIITILSTTYGIWIRRTRESLLEYYENQSEITERYGNVFHYSALAAGIILNLSVIGYLIYAVCTL